MSDDLRTLVTDLESRCGNLAESLTTVQRELRTAAEANLSLLGLLAQARAERDEALAHVAELMAGRAATASTLDAPPLLKWLPGRPTEPEMPNYMHACGADGRVYVLCNSSTGDWFWSYHSSFNIPSDLWPSDEISYALLPIDKAKAVCEALEQRYKEGKA